ncbi:MAG: SEC-C domain-containing protein, partial [Elusimicrobia bacterium]|nr:SEC-C domain-containing protein [Elusimicrobiota bacterium]
EREKFNAIVGEIDELWRKRRPVLVGTRSIEKSERLAGLLREKGIPHQVLNAKYHEMEAQIIAQAGKSGQVTIATNMAGRGTDIILGGYPPEPDDSKLVVSLGGLHVLGTERHEARRIDNQLRGRCGRQGDPGSSRFYLALDDELMRLFGSDRLSHIMEKLGMEEGEVIESGLVTRQIAGAQRRVETHNFDIRKQLLDYDKVLNKQRERVYKRRNDILDGADVSPLIQEMIAEMVEDKVDLWADKEKHPEEWDMESLSAWLTRTFDADYSIPDDELNRMTSETLKDELLELVKSRYQARTKDFEGYDFKDFERMVLLQMIDQAWKNNLYDLDHLKKSIGLRAYGQKDPLIEYQKESFELFNAMISRISEQTVEYLLKIQAPPKRAEAPPKMHAEHPNPDGGAAEPSAHAPSAPPPAAPRGGDLLRKPASKPNPQIQKIGRNDPCYCGSGKKYKKCHGVGVA